LYLGIDPAEASSLDTPDIVGRKFIGCIAP
jgi:hypothetical protein